MKKVKHPNGSPVKEKSVYKKFDDENTTGIQTMLRITSSNHIRLSEIADTKANILISVNAIIISVILSVMLPNLDSEDYLALPTLIFLIVALSTIIVAIIALRPSVNRGKFDINYIESKRTNLLFFGNFHKMPFQEYDTAMRIMMQHSDYLYGSMIKDIYFLGIALAKKYQRIRLAYNIFMIGMIFSIIAFSIASFFI